LVKRCNVFTAKLDQNSETITNVITFLKTL